MILLTSILLFLFTSIYLLLLKKSIRKFKNHYSIENGLPFQIKCILFKLLVKLRSLKTPSKTNSGYGISELEIDNRRPLMNNEHAIDSVYASFGSKNGAYFMARLAYRNDNSAEIILYINIPSLGYFEIPSAPNTNIYNCIHSEKYFKAGGLIFRCIEQKLKWIIRYDGLLRKNHHENGNYADEELVYCQLYISWDATHCPHSMDGDISKTLIEGIAREEWSREFFNNLKNSHNTHTQQFGEFFVTLKINDEETSLTTRGFRDHSYGIRNWADFHRYIIFMAYFDNGSVLFLSFVSMKKTVTNWAMGYIILANSVEKYNIDWIDKRIYDMGEDGIMPKNITIRFKANKEYELDVCIGDSCSFQYGREKANVRNGFAEFQLKYDKKNINGYGNVEYFYENNSPVCYDVPKENIRLLKDSFLNDNAIDKLALEFDEEECKSSLLVGGKGMQMAFLKEFYNIPDGFCLTVHAFDLFLTSNNLQKDILNLKKISIESLTTKNIERMKDECTRVVNLINNIDLEMHEKIVTIIKELYEKHRLKNVSVRSSAVGEDGDEMSAAGQLQTVLGVCKLTDILKSVRLCWSSYYNFIAVQYRLQNGQEIMGKMAIVIQEMINADKAGVIFTRHPLTNSPEFMTINANFGLGESVVSGIIDPDTIIINRRLKSFEIKERKIGEKTKTIRLADAKVDNNDNDHNLVIIGSSSGIEERTCLEENKHKLCLNDEEILRLCEIALDIERHFDSGRDIEWAIYEKKIYVLQARPISNENNRMPETHLNRQFDTAMTSDSQLTTRANIGEMFPGPATPLSISTFVKANNYTFDKWFTKIGGYSNNKIFTSFLNNRFTMVSHNYLFLNLNALLLVCCRTFLGNKPFAELALLGRTLKDEELSCDDLFEFWPQVSFFRKLSITIRYVWQLLSIKRELNDCIRLAKEYERNNKFDKAAIKSSIELWSKMDANFLDLLEAWKIHIINSAEASSWTNILLGVLSSGKAKFTVENYGEAALLISQNNRHHHRNQNHNNHVVSADVPKLLTELCAEMRKNNEFVQEFIKSSSNSKDKLPGIVEKYDCIRDKFQMFLKEQGHRCIGEAEMKQPSWSSQPIEILVILKQMMASLPPNNNNNNNNNINDGNNTTNNIENGLGNLPKRNIIKRKIIQFFAKKASSGVSSRELSKSVCVKIHDVFKKAYKRLGDMMVNEGRIPDSNLVYFMTHDEIGRFLSSKSPSMLFEFKRRQRNFHQFEKLQFNKINLGRPIPASKTEIVNNKCKTLKGMPVSHGVVSGKARVVLNLEEASFIDNGDILVVPYTDVGWSPYFPLINGLITEIGGLVSHGSVVAREYGLPCVVGVDSATIVIKTGDRIRIDGKMGSVEILEI